MPSLRRGGTLALMCAVYLAAGVTLASVGPGLIALAANVEREVAVVGSIFTAFSLGTIVVQLAIASLSRRLGQQAVLTLGLALMGGGMLGATLSDQLGLLLGGALVSGLGFGCILSTGSVLVPRLFPARSAAALNLVNLFFGVGSILGPLTASWAGARIGAPLAGLWLGAGLLLVIAPIGSFAATVDEPPGRRELGGAVPWPLVFLLGAFLLMYSGTEIALGGWAAVYLQVGAGMSLERAAQAVAGFWLALTLGRGAGAALGLRLRASALLLGAVGLMLGGTVLLALAGSNPDWAILALLVIGFACGPVFPTTMALVAAVSSGRSAAASLALGIGNLGGATIPPAVGLVLSRAGPQTTAWTLVAATLLLGGLGVAAGLTIQRRRAG